jgi:hypothetical protein
MENLFGYYNIGKKAYKLNKKNKKIKNISVFVPHNLVTIIYNNNMYLIEIDKTIEYLVDTVFRDIGGTYGTTGQNLKINNKHMINIEDHFLDKIESLNVFKKKNIFLCEIV